jgi:hypothetical protein
MIRINKNESPLRPLTEAQLTSIIHHAFLWIVRDYIIVQHGLIYAQSVLRYRMYLLINLSLNDDKN